MLPALLLLSTYALIRIPKRFVIVAVFLMTVQLIYVLVRVYTIAPAKFASFWSAEAKNASLLAINNQNKGTTIVLSTKTDNIEYAYPVYAKIDPNLVIDQYGKFPKIYGNVVITDK